MELHSRVFKVALAGVVGLVAVIGSQKEGEALTSYTNLCDSAPGACEYAPKTAPTLDADVCYNGSIVKLKTASCPFGYWPYYVSKGEVIDPITSQVQAYITLPDACDQGYCRPRETSDPPGEAGPMCCDPGSGNCFESSDGCPVNQIAVWCPDGFSPVQQQGGDFVCVED